jgi:hypothetical protein
VRPPTPIGPCARQRLILTLAGLAILVTSCVIPIPEKETVVSGHSFTDDEVRTMISEADTLPTVKARLGEPTVDYGPGRVFVYLWTVNKGSLVWIVGAGGLGGVGTLPMTASHMLFVAFDAEGQVLKTGTAEYLQSRTISEHLRKWLLANALANSVAGPRVEGDQPTEQPLFVYRSPCPSHFTDKTLRPAIAVDGHFVGDFARGEYLASAIQSGSHEITIDPLPYYRSAGGRIPPEYRTKKTLNINTEPNQVAYIEAYVCECTMCLPGKVDINAASRDPATALQAMRNQHAAW